MKKISIEKDWILRQIPLQVDAKDALAFDSIRMVSEFVVFNYNYLCDALNQFSNHEIKPPISFIFMNIWGIIDSAGKLSRMIKLLGLTTISADVIAFFDDIYKVRNTFQHLDERIGEVFLPQQVPVLGFITWINKTAEDEFKAYTVSSGLDVQGGLNFKVSFNSNNIHGVGIYELKLMTFVRNGAVTIAIDEVVQKIIDVLNIIGKELFQRYQILFDNNIIDGQRYSSGMSVSHTGYIDADGSANFNSQLDIYVEGENQ